MTVSKDNSARRGVNRRSVTTITALAAGVAFAVAPLSAATAAPSTAVSAVSAAAAASSGGTDQFNRTVSNGWGTGALGAWKLRDAASRYSVSKGSGVLTLKPGEGAKATTAPTAWKYNPTYGWHRKHVNAKFTLQNASQGSGQYVSVIAHEVGSKSISLRVVAKPGSSEVELEWRVDGTTISRYPTSTLGSEISSAPGTEYTLDVTLTHLKGGKGRVGLEATLSSKGNDYPAIVTSEMLVVDEAFAAANGSAGIEYYQSGGATSKGVLKLDSFTAEG